MSSGALELSGRDTPPGRQEIVARRRRNADVSVVLCAYTEERWDELFAAVMSVRTQTVRARETIIVIDNNPKLADTVRRCLPGLQVLENTGPRGAGTSRNLGVAAARGSIIAFLDDDAVAHRCWIERALGAFEDPDTIGVGGTIEPAWEEATPRWIAEEFYWTVGCTYPGLPKTPEAVRNLIAANMFVRRDAFLKLGGFRSGFGKTGPRSGTEETELCIRASQRWPERRWLYDPSVHVRHRVPRSRSSIRYFLERCYDEGIAKASIVRMHGGGDGLAAERSYTLRTLPLGVLRGVSSAARGAEPAGLARSLSILVGLAATATGYLLGRLREAPPAAEGQREPPGENV